MNFYLVAFFFLVISLIPILGVLEAARRRMHMMRSIRDYKRALGKRDAQFE